MTEQQRKAIQAYLLSWDGAVYTSTPDNLADHCKVFTEDDGWLDCGPAESILDELDSKRD